MQLLKTVEWTLLSEGHRAATLEFLHNQLFKKELFMNLIRVSADLTECVPGIGSRLQ